MVVVDGAVERGLYGRYQREVVDSENLTDSRDSESC